MNENINELLPYNLRLVEPYTIEVQVISVESRLGCERIKYLSERYPFIKYNLLHLKRAKKSPCKIHLDLIVAPKEEIEEIEEFEPISYNCTSCGMFKTVKVPRIPPYTKKQLIIWSKL